MKLWFFCDNGWDKSFAIVRAETREQALDLWAKCYDYDSGKLPPDELVADGEPGVLWTYEQSGPRSD